MTNFGSAATLSKTDVALITQPYATTTRNAVTDFFRYNGSAQIEPRYDGGFDVTRAPDFNLEQDGQQFVDFVESIQEFLPLQQVSANRVLSNRTIGYRS